jgi:integrase
MYRPALATTVFAGLRAMELLALTWLCIDAEDGVIHVRHQLTRSTRSAPPRRVALKTRAAVRDVVVLPELADLLRDHRREAFRQGRARREDYAFATSEGTPIGYRNLAQRGLTKAADRAQLNTGSQAKLTLHDLRHTYGPHLVRQGTDVVTVSRQMGHARPSITLDIYAHEFAAVQHRDSVASKLSEAFSVILDNPQPG